MMNNVGFANSESCQQLSSQLWIGSGGVEQCPVISVIYDRNFGFRQSIDADHVGLRMLRDSNDLLGKLCRPPEKKPQRPRNSSGPPGYAHGNQIVNGHHPTYSTTSVHSPARRTDNQVPCPRGSPT